MDRARLSDKLKQQGGRLENQFCEDLTMEWAAWKRRDLLKVAAAISAAPLSSVWLRDAEAAADGTLTVAISDNPITCDPINMASHDTEILSQVIWENLVDVTIDGELKPQLAKALPEVSEDRLTYSFELRDDVFFQDGQKLTAEDVKYSFEYMLDPAHKAGRRPVFSRLSHVEIDSPTKLRVILKEPFSPWVYFLYKHMGIFPAGSREKYGEDYFKMSPKNVGTGVGIFEEWRPNDYVSFVRNPNYWQKGKPAWERLVVRIVPEDASRVAYLLNGQADIIGAPPPRDFARLKTRPHIQGETRATFGGWSVLLMNSIRPPFDDINFRKAMSHAIDRKTICEKIYYGLVEQSGIPAPASSWWYDKAADDLVPYDLDKAKFYLKQSKYADSPKFDLMSSSVPYLLDAKDCVVFIQSELAKIGITVNLTTADNAIVQDAFARGEFAAMFRNIMSPGEATYFITSSFTPDQYMTKSSNYTNPKIGEMLKVVFREDPNNHEKLKLIFADMWRLLAEESPHVWVGYFNATNLWRDRVKDFKSSRGLTINVHDVTLSA
jgi:peptide/nickel transport system substrate-binding protein